MPDAAPVERLAEFTRLSDLAAAAMQDLETCERDPKRYKIEMPGSYECSTDRKTGQKVVNYASAIVQLRFDLPPVLNAWNPSRHPRVAKRDREKIDALGWLATGRADLALQKFYGSDYPSAPHNLATAYAIESNAWHDDMNGLIVWLGQCEL